MPEEDARVDVAQGMDASSATKMDEPSDTELEGQTPNPTRPVCVADWAMLYGGE